jgi:hypothetical protein
VACLDERPLDLFYAVASAGIAPHTCTHTTHDQPAARSEGPKAADLAGFIGSNTRTALFFCACVGMSLTNNISARNFRAAKFVVLLSDCKWESGSESGCRHARGHTPPPLPHTLDLFRAISAEECLVVSTVALCGTKLNSLTPLGPVVLPLLKTTM